MARVVVDAGHGGSDPGAVYHGRKEKDDTLALALEVGRILAENGVDVIYTRTDDIYETPFQKAQKGNQAEADLFLSIHRNSSPTANQYSGIESLVFQEEGIKKELAENINRELEKAGFSNLGIRERPGLVVLRRTRMPAVLVEVGFINTDEDNEQLDQNFDGAARAIADGILMTLEENGFGETSFEQVNGAETEEDAADTGKLYDREENPEIPYYRVQVGAFRQRLYAENLRRRLESEGFPAEQGMEGDLHIVWVGEYAELDNAAKMEQNLRNYGYATFISSVE